MNETSGFAGVPESAWNVRVGGHQVCYQWLAARRRAKVELTDTDVAHFGDIVARVVETLRLTALVDEAGLPS